MKIGHAKAKSETFLPTWRFDESEKILYLDVAGRNDTRGDICDIINFLLIKKIFNCGKKVRLLVVFPFSDLENSRGHDLK